MAWPSTQTFWVAPKRDILVAFSVIGIVGWQVSCKTIEGKANTFFLNAYSQTSVFFFFFYKLSIFTIYILSQMLGQCFEVLEAR